MSSDSNSVLPISITEIQDVMSVAPSKILEHSNNIQQELCSSSSEFSEGNSSTSTTKSFVTSSQVPANFIKFTPNDLESKSSNENLYTAINFSKEAPNEVGKNSTENQGVSSAKKCDVPLSKKCNSIQLGLFEVNESSEITHPAHSRETESSKFIHPVLSETTKVIQPSFSEETESTKVIQAFLSEHTEATKVIQSSFSVEPELTKVIKLPLSGEYGSTDKIQPSLSEETEGIHPSISEDTEGIHRIISEETESNKVIQSSISEETKFTKAIQSSISEETKFTKAIQSSISEETKLTIEKKLSFSEETESTQIRPPSLSKDTESLKVIQPAPREKKVPTRELEPVHSEVAGSTQVQQQDNKLEELNLNKISTFFSLEGSCCSKGHISVSDFESSRSNEKSDPPSESENNIALDIFQDILNNSKFPNAFDTECLLSPQNTDEKIYERNLIFPGGQVRIAETPPVLPPDHVQLRSSPLSENPLPKSPKHFSPTIDVTVRKNISSTPLITLINTLGDFIIECNKRISEGSQLSNSEDLVDYLKDTFPYGIDLLKQMNLRVSALLTAAYGLLGPTTVLSHEPRNGSISIRDSLLSAGLQVQWRLIALEDELFLVYLGILSDYETSRDKIYDLLTREAIDSLDKIFEHFEKFCVDVQKIRDSINNFCLEMDRIL